MAIQNDWTLDYTSKKISHTSGATRYTVNALYSWLMDLFDNAGQMDDTIPISAQTPTEYSLINGWTFNADTDLEFLYGGSVVVTKATTDKDIWANFYTLGTIQAGSVVYWYQNGALLATYAAYTSGHIDQLIKVTAGGADIDSKNVTAYIRNIGDNYDFFQVQATATGGRNPVPLSTSDDTNDDATGGSVVGVAITFGSVSKDIGDGLGAASYDCVVDGGGNSILDVYRYLKYVTRRQNTAALDTGAAQGRFYQGAQTAYSPIKTAPFGTFAGGKFFGARGIWLENVSDPENRQLIDAGNVSHIPPLAFTVTVSGVAAGDQVLVARTASGAIDKSQFTISTTTGTSITATVAIGADIAASGTLRIGDTQYTYTGVSAATFTGVSPSPSGQTGGFYVPLIDAAAAGTSVTSASMIYVANFDVVARVRHKGILPFENTGTVLSSGLTISAIRTTDTIVS